MSERPKSLTIEIMDIEDTIGVDGQKGNAADRLRDLIERARACPSFVKVGLNGNKMVVTITPKGLTQLFEFFSDNEE